MEGLIAGLYFKMIESHWRILSRGVMTVDGKRNGCGRFACRPLGQSENTSKGFSDKNCKMDTETRRVHPGGVV